MNLTTALLVVAGIAFVLVRRLAGEPLEGRRLVLPPLVLLLIGGYQMAQLGWGRSVHHIVVDGLVLGLGVVFALVGGYARGLTADVFVRDGYVWYRYTWLTVAVWVSLVVLRLGQLATGRELGADQQVMTAALLVVLGLSFLIEAAVLGRKALATGAPFAPRGARRRARAAN